MSRRPFAAAALAAVALAGCSNTDGADKHTFEGRLLGSDTHLYVWAAVSPERDKVTFELKYKGGDDTSVDSYRVCFRERCATDDVGSLFTSGDEGTVVINIDDVKAGLPFPADVDIDVTLEKDKHGTVSGTLKSGPAPWKD